MIVEFVANALLASILFILLAWVVILSLAYIGTKHQHERQMRWMQARLDVLTHRVNSREDEEMGCEELHIWRE